MEACYLYESKNIEELFGKLLEIKTHRDAVNALLLSTSREEDLQKLIKENIGIEIGVLQYRHEQATQIYQGQSHLMDYEWYEGFLSIRFDKHLIISTKNTKVDTNPPISQDGIIDLDSYGESYSITDLINLLDFSFESTKKMFSINFISPYSNSNQELENIIGQSKLDEKYDALNKYLSELFDVTSIDIIKNKPMLKSGSEYRELSQFGQGIKTFINTIGSMLLLKNNFIFIDEIENGIHYTNFDKLWEIILTISKEQNVQVFATTHSKEMIESYARVAKKLEDDEIAFVELGRDKQGDVQSIILDRKSLEFELSQNHEVRGW
jgi:AAA15 family ATPase/GTPase